MADSSALDCSDDLAGTQQQLHLTSSSSVQNPDYGSSTTSPFLDRGDQSSTAAISQSQLFLEILDQVPLEPTNANTQQNLRMGLTAAEKSTIMDGMVSGGPKPHSAGGNGPAAMKDNKGNQHMLAMIFKFFLQTGEYDFFVQRLRNAANTIGKKTDMEANFFKDDDNSVRTRHCSLY